MLKFKLIISLLIFSLLFVNIASATSIDIILPEKIPTIYTTEKNLIKIAIVNIGEKKDTFYISVWPSAWVTLDRYFATLNPGQSETFSLTIEPPIDAPTGNTVFYISARSVDTGEGITKDIVLTLRRKTGIYISELKLNQQIVKPGENLVIQPIITNLETTKSKQVFITTKILKDDLLVQKLEGELLVEPQTAKSITQIFQVNNKYIFGVYTIETELKDILNQPIHKKSTTFLIQKTEGVSKEKEIQYGLLSTTIVLKIINTGNVPNSNYSITESMPRISKYFFHPEIEPVLEEEKENRIVYTWEIINLNPNETRLIKYQFRFINLFIISIIIIIILVVFSYIYFKPILVKRYSGKLVHEKETLVALYVRNNSRKEIKNIIVKDFVPSVATVVKKFDTLVPEIKQTKSGTQLIWKIDKIKPREERILTYMIKPVIHIIGGFKLPKAHFTYRTEKGVIDKIAEKIVVMTKKIK